VDVVLSRRPYSSRVRIDVDHCPQCGGIWLDADELAHIRRVAADPER
jgi:Zn-finger nucleic acid-binding protein